MKTLSSKCDFCLQEVTDMLGVGYEEPRRLFKLGTREACGNCHEKAQRLLEINMYDMSRGKWCEHNKNISGKYKPCPICELNRYKAVSLKKIKS